jgi:hypothetical protein
MDGTQTFVQEALHQTHLQQHRTDADEDRAYVAAKETAARETAQALTSLIQNSALMVVRTRTAVRCFFSSSVVLRVSCWRLGLLFV